MSHFPCFNSVGVPDSSRIDLDRRRPRRSAFATVLAIASALGLTLGQTICLPGQEYESSTAEQTAEEPPPVTTGPAIEDPALEDPALEDMESPAVVEEPSEPLDEGEAVASIRDSNSAKTPQDELRAKLAKPGKLTLRDATLNEALFAIREHWKISIVFGNDLQGEVNAVFPEQPLHQILDTLLFSRGYGYRIVGTSLVIMKREDIKGMDPLFQTVTIPLKFGEADEITNTIEKLGIQSPNGKLLAVRAAKAILVMDYPEQIRRIREQIDALEERYASISKAQTQLLAQSNNSANSSAQPPNSSNSAGSTPETIPAPEEESKKVGYFKANHVNVEVLRDSLNMLLSKDGVLNIVPKENRIVVLDYSENIERIRTAVEELDVPRAQVRIWALIYDASIDDAKRVGINWQNSIKGRNLNAAGVNQDSISLRSETAAAPVGPNGGLTFMSLNTNLDVTAVVNMLNSSKNSRLLANPNVTVLDKEIASIKIVTEIPFQQLTQGGNSGGPIGTTAFREAGVSLEVTPKIADNGWIEMKVKPTFSLLTGFTQQSNQPIIDRREAETFVWIPNNETFVIGGLRQRQANNEGTGIPVLQDMKFGLGRLFRHKATTIRESELLVFLTPQIVASSCRLQMPNEATAFDYGRYMLHHIPHAPYIPATDPNYAIPGNGPLYNEPIPLAPADDSSPEPKAPIQALPDPTDVGLPADQPPPVHIQAAELRPERGTNPMFARRVPPPVDPAQRFYSQNEGNDPRHVQPNAPRENLAGVSPVGAEFPRRTPAAIERSPTGPRRQEPRRQEPPRTVLEAVRRTVRR